MNKEIREIAIDLTAEQTETLMRLGDKQMARERISKTHDSETSEETDKIIHDIASQHNITDTNWFRLDLKERKLLARYEK